jgi:hypothetical protein
MQAYLRAHPGLTIEDVTPVRKRAPVAPELPEPPPPAPVQQSPVQQSWVPDKPLAYFEDVELLLHAVQKMQRACRQISETQAAQQDRLADQHKATEALRQQIADRDAQIAELTKQVASTDIHMAEIAKLHCTVAALEKDNEELELKLAQVEFADVAQLRKQIDALEAKATEPDPAIADIAELHRRTTALEMRATDAATSAVAVVNEQTSGIWDAVNELHAKSELLGKRIDDTPMPIPDDVDATYDGERTISFKFTVGGETRTRDFNLPIPIYRGVWHQAEYVQGDMCTYSGGIWSCEAKSTTARPGGGEGNGWRLSTKAGRNGRNAYELARAAGFNGTEKEWLASLKGKDGHSTNTLHLPAKTNAVKTAP